AWRCQVVWRAASVVTSRRSHSLGWRGPFFGLTPGVLAGRTGGGSYSWALSTRREISRTRAAPQTWASRRTAKPLSPTTWLVRWGCQRRMRRTSPSVRSGAVRWDFPSLALVAGVQVGIARNGRAQRRRLQGMG